MAASSAHDCLRLLFFYNHLRTKRKKPLKRPFLRELLLRQRRHNALRLRQMHSWMRRRTLAPSAPTRTPTLTTRALAEAMGSDSGDAAASDGGAQGDSGIGGGSGRGCSRARAASRAARAVGGRLAAQVPPLLACVHSQWWLDPQHSLPVWLDRRCGKSSAAVLLIAGTQKYSRPACGHVVCRWVRRLE